MKPTNYDIYLLRSDDHPLDRAGLLEALGSLPVRQAADDPSRYLYHNDDTGVYCQLLLSPEVLSNMAPPTSEGDTDPEEESFTSTGNAEPPDPEEDEEDEDEEDGESFDIEMAPVTLTLPLVCPGFFGREVVALAERLAQGGRLSLGHPAHEETSETAEGDSVTPTDLMASWNAANHKAASTVKEQGSLTVWSEKKAEDWWVYGTHRQTLEGELGSTGVYVPRLQTAFHGQRIKSLLSWDLTTPIVLPRTDLVLIRVERKRKGLLFNRRVTMEGLVNGETLWDSLAAFSEVRSDPVDLLIFREAARPPPQVAAALEKLTLEPLESAQRAELTGTNLSGVGRTWMVDFETTVR